MKLSVLQKQLLEFQHIQPLQLNTDFAQLRIAIDDGTVVAIADTDPQSADTASFATVAVTFPPAKAALTLAVQAVLADYAPDLQWQIGGEQVQLEQQLLTTPLLLTAADKRRLWQLIGQYSDHTDPQRN